jgi:hypothetical protein
VFIFRGRGGEGGEREEYRQDDKNNRGKGEGKKRDGGRSNKIVLWIS